jgi:NFU1 iron-sulfur cluster scaffold homolog, mitochondrial
MTLLALKEIFDEEINPLAEADGGYIELIGIQNGFVMVKMRGACSNCPSSLVTLKQGITMLLEEYFPEEFLAVVALEET